MNRFGCYWMYMGSAAKGSSGNMCRTRRVICRHRNYSFSVVLPEIKGGDQIERDGEFILYLIFFR